MDFYVMLGGLVEDEAALVGVGYEGDVGLVWGAGRGVEVQDHVVREGGGEDQGRAFNGKDDGGFEEAGYVGGVGWAQGRRDGSLNGGKADDEDGFGVVERRRGVEAEVESFFLRERDGRDVLVLRGVEAGGEADEIDDGADVGGVKASGG